MEIDALVEKLKDDEAGRLFWLHLCAHLHEEAVDLSTAKEVFRSTRDEYQRLHGTDSPPNSGAVIYRILCARTWDNTVAIGSLRHTQEVDWSQISEISTVINDSSWWAYYAEARADGHKDVLERIATEVGTLQDFSDASLGALLLERCKRENRGDLTTIFGDSLKNGFLRTDVNRFWASFQSGDRPASPEALVARLGLTSIRKGQWVIEVVYNVDVIRELIRENGEIDFKRPSALCVNDRTNPRFRALTPDEVGCRSRGEDLIWHGMTFDLSQWGMRDTSAMNGLPELICPFVKWGANTLPPPKVSLTGLVTNPVAGPSNKEFADYLELLFSQALANEANLVSNLAT